jgi:hypothetical protein
MNNNLVQKTIEGKTVDDFSFSKQAKHYWLTPPEIYAKLDEEFCFNFDPCPFPRPEGFDGLQCEWGSSSYVNPPFRKNMNKWIHKGIEEHRKGKTVVFLIPTLSFIGYLLRENAELRSMGRMPFLSVEDRKPQPGPMEIMLAVLRSKEPKRS